MWFVLASREEKNLRAQAGFSIHQSHIMLAIRVNLSSRDRITLVQFSTGTGQFTSEMIDIAPEKDVVNIRFCVFFSDFSELINHKILI